ncbi:hypothetical protein L3Q82_008268 [Scortum barcoo]|uniref:Uncharacterized protein n=1 Tax=Scortum barcoo TaxID=214431 RepID=A0ACB8WHG6_9TELE|nr:hypothetical protein L3Q82_008268 [Scortum barcoo]
MAKSAAVERVSSTKFLGVHISDDLSWTTNTASLAKKAQQRLYFLRKLKRASAPPPIMTTFYRGTIESILTTCITVWGGSYTVHNRKALQRIVRTAERIIGVPLPSLQDLYTTRLTRKAITIVNDASHPAHSLFSLLPSGKRKPPTSTQLQRNIRDTASGSDVRRTNQRAPRTPPYLGNGEHHSNGIRESTTSRHPRKDSHRVPSGELQMARAIHEKQLMLQEKLRRAEEKIRQKIQRDSTDAAERYDHESEEERHSGKQAERGKALTKTRLSEQQRREPVRSREMTMQGKRQEDVKQLRKSQDVRSEDRVRNTNEGERATWKRREIVQSPQPQRNRTKGTPLPLVADKGRTREKKYRERMCKEMNNSEEEQDMPQMSQQKTSHRRPEQAEFELTESPAASLQLLPCKLCNRKFVSERLEKHVQICKKVNQSHRPVFNSYVNRTKGSAIEEFWKTHSRAKTPEVGPPYRFYSQWFMLKASRVRCFMLNPANISVCGETS